VKSWNSVGRCVCVSSSEGRGQSTMTMKVGDGSRLIESGLSRFDSLQKRDYLYDGPGVVLYKSGRRNSR